jgi:TatD DNase family protein
MLIDTHCHIDRFRDASGLAQRCEAAKIFTVAVTNIPSHFEQAASHLRGMKYVKAALGFHPLAVAENQSELSLFLKLLPKADFIGEIGLDLSKEGVATKSSQFQVFDAIVAALTGQKKFVTMHSRGAADAVLEILERHDFHHAVFHWFSGSIKCLERAIQWGCWFSANTSMIESQKGIEILSKIPRNRVLTESDGPYVKVGKRAAEPSDVGTVVARLAELWEVSPSAVKAQLSANFEAACGSPG